MKLIKFIAAAAVAASFGPGFAQAQSISKVQAPAEFPPASYSGRQYVDSKGCVFVRAGIDGNVSWIPRVSRNRKVICGFQPSLPTGSGRSLASTPKQASEPVQITVAQPAAKPAATAAAKPVKKAQPKPVAVKKTAPKPVIVAQPKPVQPAVVQVPKRTVTVAQPKIVTVQPQPTTVVVQPVVKRVPKTVTIATAKPAPQPKTMAPRQSACRGASSISSQYLTASGGHAVRCGPQADWNVGVINGGNGRSYANSAPVVTTVASAPTYQAATTQTYSYQQPVPLKRAAPTTVVKVTPNTRIVPKHVYQTQVASTRGVYVPKGYKPVWDDDRLNTKRAHQTFAGKAKMDLRWTNTVPRRLIDAASGREVSYLYPGLQYPNTSYDQQMIAGVSASASTPKATQAARTSSALQSRDSMEAKPAKRTQNTTRTTVSTRSSTVKTKVKPAKTTQTRASHRYVQAGMFELATAQQAAQRLANSGLPTRMAKRTRGGKTYGVVVTGPYATQGQLNAALNKVRGMGFGGASLRN